MISDFTIHMRSTLRQRHVKKPPVCRLPREIIDAVGCIDRNRPISDSNRHRFKDLILKPTLSHSLTNSSPRVTSTLIIHSAVQTPLAELGETLKYRIFCKFPLSPVAGDVACGPILKLSRIKSS